MGYQLTTSKYKYDQNQAKQEVKLIDIENMSSLLLESNLDSGDTTICKTNWGKERRLNRPEIINNTKGLELTAILKRAGINEKMISSIPPSKTIVTHSPPFHADDLIACALMGKYYEYKCTPYSIAFSRDQKVINRADAAVDVGGEHIPETLRFDHHQITNSNKAATGLVADFLEKEVGFEWVSLLKPTLEKIDKADLGKPERPQDLKISEALGNFNPTWKEKQNQQFFQALAIIEECLEKSLEELKDSQLQQKEGQGGLSTIFEKNLLNHPELIKREKQIEEAKIEGNTKFISSAIQNQQSGIAKTQHGIDFYLLFTQEYLALAPTKEAKALKAINYITFETPTGAINAIAAPTPENKMAQKHPFPQEWRGKRGQELIDAISKSTDLKFPPVLQEKANEYFCHNAGFFLTLPSIHKDTFDEALSYCAKTAQKLESIKSKIGKKEDKLQTRDAWGRGGPL